MEAAVNDAVPGAADGGLIKADLKGWAGRGQHHFGISRYVIIVSVAETNR